MPFRALALVLLAAVLLVVWRELVGRVVERRAALRRVCGADGVITGAGAIALDAPADAPAVLFLHGFGDTPQSLSTLAMRVHRAGFAVAVPLLPGHARSLRDFACSDAERWLAAALASYDALRERHERVGIVGQSMGGALAATVAAERPGARALVLLAPYFEAPALVRWMVRARWVAGVLLPYLPARDERSILDAAARAASLGHDVVTPRLLRELAEVARRARSALPRVVSPTLIIQSRHDNRVPSAVAERALERLGARTTRLEWLEGSGHVISVDREEARVATLVTRWLRDHVAPASPAAAPSGHGQ